MSTTTPALPGAVPAVPLQSAAVPSPPAPRRTASRPLGRDGRVTGQPAFVLHSYPHKETSLIIDVLTRDHGRIALVAKGAKRPHSQLRGVLQTFQPLQAGWTGKSELRILTGAEWVGGMLPLLPERIAGQIAGARRSAPGLVRPLRCHLESTGAQ